MSSSIVEEEAMPDRPFETVPALPWQAEHKKADCDRCRGDHAHLFKVGARWLCAYCKNALERLAVRA